MWVCITCTNNSSSGDGGCGGGGAGVGGAGVDHGAIVRKRRRIRTPLDPRSGRARRRRQGTGRTEEVVVVIVIVCGGQHVVEANIVVIDDDDLVARTPFVGCSSGFVVLVERVRAVLVVPVIVVRDDVAGRRC